MLDTLYFVPILATLRDMSQKYPIERWKEGEFCFKKSSFF